MLLLHGADPSQRDSQGGIWGCWLWKSSDIQKFGSEYKMSQNDGWLVSSVSVISLDLEYPLG